MVAATVVENGGGGQEEYPADGNAITDDDKHQLVISTKEEDIQTASSVKDEKMTSTTVNNEDNSNNNEGNGNKNNTDEITFLIEIVKATIPKTNTKHKKNYKTNESSSKRGMHCTTSWIGPINPSGRKRRENIIHRTKMLKSKSSNDVTSSTTASGTGSTDQQQMNNEDEEGEEGEDMEVIEHVFTVNDSSLFLFKTSMKQLVNASLVDTLNSGGLRFDIFDRPLDNMFTSVVFSDNNITEKETSAITRESVSSSKSKLLSTSYRLVGSVFLTPKEILDKCDEVRFECQLFENWRKVQQQPQQQQTDSNARSSTIMKSVNGASLALRIRVASTFDIDFIKSLSKDDTNTNINGVNVALQSTLIQHDGGSSTNQTKKKTKKLLLKPATLITELDENLLTAETSIKAISNISPIAQESVRYLFSSDTEKRLLVKPYPDPSRVEETTFFTEEMLHHECYKMSTNWIQAGQQSCCGGSEGSNSLGKVYLEVLECRGLPNTDAGGAVGNKTDAFISIVYNDIMVQTEVIDDSCSPMWMPWCSRAFVFQLGHPSSCVHIGVADYDIGPMEHECIGRVAINPIKFSPGTMYTLTYNLYESSNLIARDDMGTITLRLRIEIPDEKKYLLEGRKPPEKRWVNSQQWKSHRVAKYCVDGPHDEEVFEMALFRSHINELLTQKRYVTYAIYDAIRSLIYWRGQVKVGKVWLPLHSAIIFYFSVHVVENPHLLPSFLCFGCGWIMLANMLNRVDHPNPWHRGHSFLTYFNILTRGQAYHATHISPLEGHKEATKLESKWKQRLDEDDAKYYKQLEQDEKLKSISDDAVIRTKSKASANTAIVDPVSALAGAKLLPYQQRLGRYCNKVRYIRNIMNWNESIIAFFLTLTLFGAGFVALFVPWRFILQWTTRIVVWVFLGPWMWIMDQFFHEETEHHKKKARRKARQLFRQQQQLAKSLQENGLKMKAFRVKLFGQFITRLPEFNLTRHEDVPLPESSAEPYHSEEEIKVDRFVPSQDLSGDMIPMTGQDVVASRLKKQKEKEGLLGRYTKMAHAMTSRESVPEEEVDEGFELIGSENRVVCMHSESSGEADEKSSTELAATTLNSERENIISDKAIQLTSENQLQPLNSSKSKWVFSASIQLSLRKETVEDNPTPALPCGKKKGLIKQTSELAEQGVEVVPLLGSDDDVTAQPYAQSRLEDETDDPVSVFYVKDDSKHTMNNSNDATYNDEKKSKHNSEETTTENDNKKVRFNEPIEEID